MSFLYTPAKDAFLNGDIDLTNDVVKVALIDAADYTASTSHMFLSEVPAVARVATSLALTGKTVSGGAFDANDVVLSGVTGDTVEALLLFQDTGVEATSRLIAYINSGASLPLAPTGGSVTIAWDNGSNKIFAWT
jgi:hypothetical protein